MLFIGCFHEATLRVAKEGWDWLPAAQISFFGLPGATPSSQKPQLEPRICEDPVAVADGPNLGFCSDTAGGWKFQRIKHVEPKERKKAFML